MHKDGTNIPAAHVAKDPQLRNHITIPVRRLLLKTASRCLLQKKQNAIECSNNGSRCFIHEHQKKNSHIQNDPQKHAQPHNQSNSSPLRHSSDPPAFGRNNSGTEEHFTAPRLHIINCKTPTLNPPLPSILSHPTFPPLCSQDTQADGVPDPIPGGFIKIHRNLISPPTPPASRRSPRHSFNAPQLISYPIKAEAMSRNKPEFTNTCEGGRRRSGRRKEGKKTKQMLRAAKKAGGGRARRPLVLTITKQFNHA